jgi:hypothetical protein
MLPLLSMASLEIVADWVFSLLSALSHTGTALTVAILVTAIVLATRCGGRCSEDSIVRPHVV